MKKITFLLIIVTFLNACTQYVMGSAGPNSYHKMEMSASGQSEDISKAICGKSGTEKVQLGGNDIQNFFSPFTTIISFGLMRAKVIETKCYVRPVISEEPTDN